MGGFEYRGNGREVLEILRVEVYGRKASYKLLLETRHSSSPTSLSMRPLPGIRFFAIVLTAIGMLLV